MRSNKMPYGQLNVYACSCVSSYDKPIAYVCGHVRELKLKFIAQNVKHDTIETYDLAFNIVGNMLKVYDENLSYKNLYKNHNTT